MPATSGSGTIGSAAITGNPPSGQAGKVAVIPKFKVRILDPVSGAVKIDPLPYTHMSEFEVIMPQSGMSGASAVGHFIIHLYHPLTDEYAWAKAQYDLLDQMQRVEFYLIDADSPGVTGDPAYTGVIINLPKEDTSFRIEGQDSLKLLELSRTLQSDTFTGRTDQLVSYALKTYQLTKGDDWSGDLTAYTNNGTWALTTDQGFLAVKAGFAGDGQLFTNASYTNAKYADCFVEAPFHVTCGTIAGQTANPGVLAAVTDTNNMVLGAATMRFVAAGQWAVDASLWQKSGGVWTLQAQTQNVTTETQPTVELTITLVGVQTTATTYTWRVLVNEIDSKCAWLQNVTAGNPTGGVGLRITQGASAFVQHHLVFMSKTNAFQPGNIAVGSQRINQPIPSQTNIDLLTLAMSTENAVWRKNPKAGLNNDQIDFAVSVGGDLSGIVRLEQDQTIISSQTEANAEPLNTAVLIAGQDGYDNIGLHRWYDITAINRRGMIMGPHVAPQTSDTFSLRQMAQNVLLNRKQPTQAKRLTVLRSEDHAELPNQPKPTGLSYREGDWVTLHKPREGLNYQRIQLMSLKVTEGVPVMELTADQYPVVTDRLPLVDRLNSIALAAQMRSSDAGAKDPATGVSFNRRLMLPINPWKMRVYLAGVESVASAGGGGTVVVFDTIDYDSSNGFDLAVTHGWKVPINGWYVCHLCVTWAPAGAMNWFVSNAHLYESISGVGFASSNVVNGMTAGAIITGTNYNVLVSDTVYLSAGEVLLGVTSQQNSAGLAQTIVAGQYQTYMTINLISG